MSFSKEKRERIIIYLVEKIDMDDKEAVKKTGENFEITVTSVRRYLEMLLNNGNIAKDEKKQCGYSLYVKKNCFIYQNDRLDESDIFFHDIAPLLTEYTQEVQKLWAYIFTEICNNAIDHAKCSRIKVEVHQNMLYTDLVVQDDGIGIFCHIAETMTKELGRKVDLNAAIMELHKGKYTTDRNRHSGEGIFFVSKMAECFIVQSGGCLFKETLERSGWLTSHLLAYYQRFHGIGTQVIIRVNNFTKRKTREVFDMYCDEQFQFCKTRIPVREINAMSYPVSRSEAKRMLNRMEAFKEIILDFSDVEEMGQGFAHEVFVVFQSAYPDIHIYVENANGIVQKMIAHVTNRVL